MDCCNLGTKSGERCCTKKNSLNLSFERFPALNNLCDSILERKDISVVNTNIKEVVKVKQINQVDDNNGYSILHVACSLPNYAAIYELLKVKDINVNIQHKLGVSPLKLLFLIQLNIVKESPTNSLEELKKLLDHEERFNLDDIEINSLITLAILTTKKNQGSVDSSIIANHAQKLDALLKEKKMEKFKKTNRSEFVGKMLLNAVTSKNFPLLQRLIGQLSDDEINDGSSNPYNYTALHMAAGDGSVEAVLELLKIKNIDVNVRGADGYTPIMVAAWSCNVGVVSVLLKHPLVNLDYVDKLGRNLEDLVGQKIEKLQHFRSNGRQQVELKLDILSKIEEMNEIIKSERDTRRLRTNLTMLPTLNQQLCNAIRWDKGERDDELFMTETLKIISKSDLNKKDMNGYTALHWACVKNNKSALTALLKHKDIDVNAEDEEGHSAIIRAVWLCKKDCIELLFQDERVDLFHGNSNGRGLTYMTGKGFGCTKKQIQEVSMMIKKEIDRRETMASTKYDNLDESAKEVKLTKKKRTKKGKSKKVTEPIENVPGPIIEDVETTTEMSGSRTESTEIAETIMPQAENTEATILQTGISETTIHNIEVAQATIAELEYTETMVENIAPSTENTEKSITAQEFKSFGIWMGNFYICKPCAAKSGSSEFNNKNLLEEHIENIHKKSKGHGNILQSKGNKSETTGTIKNDTENIANNENLDETNKEIKESEDKLKQIEKELEELNRKESKELEQLLEKQNQINDVKVANLEKMQQVILEEEALEKRKIEIQTEKLNLDEKDSELNDKLSKVYIKKSRLDSYVDEQRKKLQNRNTALLKYIEMLNSKPKQPKEDEVIDIQPKENEIFDFSLERKKLDDQFIERQVEFLDKQISSIESNLECPVCFESASSPIYQCIESHLICSSCLPRVSSCPECRGRYWNPPQRNRYAENDAERLAMLVKEKQTIRNVLPVTLVKK